MRDGGAAHANTRWWMRIEGSPGRALAVLALLLGVLIGPRWYATPDAAAYLSIARRLAQGAPPHAFGQPQPSFPLGYPLLISPAFRIADHPFVLLSVINWLLAVGFMLGTYAWLRRVVPSGALLLTTLIMANVNVWNLYRRTLSEVLFLPLLMWTVVCAGSALDEPIRNRRALRALIGALLLVWLTATREAGVLVALAVAAATVMRRCTTSRLFLAVPVVAAGLVGVLRPERRAAAINAMRAAFAAGTEPGGHGLSVVLFGLRRRIVEVGQLTVPGMFKGYTDPPAWWDVNLAVGVAVLALIAAGWCRLLPRRDAFVILGPLYFVALVVWPYESGARYLLPLLPLFVACGWEAWALFGRWRRGLVALAIVAHCGVAAGYWWWIDRPRAQACDAAWRDVDSMRSMLDRNASPVAALAVPSCTHLALELVLDRPVRLIDDRMRGTDDIMSVVTPVTHAAVPGFSAASDAGPYRVWQRSRSADFTP